MSSKQIADLMVGGADMVCVYLSFNERDNPDMLWLLRELQRGEDITGADAEERQAKADAGRMTARLAKYQVTGVLLPKILERTGYSLSKADVVRIGEGEKSYYKARFFFVPEDEAVRADQSALRLLGRLLAQPWRFRFYRNEAEAGVMVSMNFEFPENQGAPKRVIQASSEPGHLAVWRN